MTTYSAPDTEFNAIGPGLNAWNMRSQNWLDESRVWKSSGTAGNETITLRPHVRRDLPGWLVADLMGDFMIEFRVPKDWDGGIPRPAVLIHRFDGGHSYLMHGNSGSLDLIAGDSFGDPEPGPSPMDPFLAFKRVDVLSINAETDEAILRVQYYIPPKPGAGELAVDPMALILSGSAYLRWVEEHHPHVPKVSDIRAALERMTPHEREVARSRAKSLAEYGKAVEEAFATMRR